MSRLSNATVQCRPDPSARPLHVLLASSYYPPFVNGGGELIAAYLAEELAARGHKVTVVSSCGPDDGASTTTVNGVEIHRLYPPNLYWAYRRQGRPLPMRAAWHVRDAWNPEAARRAMAAIAGARPDVLHTHTIEGFSGALWAAAGRQGLPVVHTAHAYGLLCPRASLVTRAGDVCQAPNMACRTYRSWHLRTTRHVDVFCTPSQFALDAFGGRLQARSLRVVNNGIPLPPHPGPRAEGGPLRLLFAAQLSALKGTEVLLEAMRRLPGDAPVALTVMGRGVLEPAVRRAAQADPRITYLGYLEGERKDRVLADADVVLMPSLGYETAGLVIVEAAAVGAGVIASRMGAIAEFLCEDRGLLIAPGDAGALADAIMRIVAQPQLLRRYRDNGPGFAANFTVARMTESYVDVYRSLVAARTEKVARP